MSETSIITQSCCLYRLHCTFPLLSRFFSCPRDPQGKKGIFVMLLVELRVSFKMKLENMYWGKDFCFWWGSF